jgi:RNA ligase
MSFVSNINLETIKEAIKDKEEFRIFERDGFIVVDYMITKPDTFNHTDPLLQQALRECRGIAFSSDKKKIISLGYHKFFNINEKEETLLSNIDFEIPHVVLNKLDGSMVRVIPVDNGEGNVAFRLGTRAGITSVSMQAERFWVRKENYNRYLNLFIDMEKDDYTPIFEYVGPSNRIVLFYEQEDLILTAIRKRSTGEYVSYSSMTNIANFFGISVVEPLFDSSENIVERVSKLQDLEGAVVRFENGTMYKMKATEYVDKHHAVSQLKLEKDVLKLIFTNNLDDVLPILNEDVRKQVESYRDKVVEASEVFENRLREKFDGLVKSVGPSENYRRDFANAVLANERHKRDSKFLFNMLDGKELDIPKYIAEHATTQSNVDSMRHIIGTHKLWQIDTGEE